MEIGSRAMSLLVADDSADDAIVLEYRAERVDTKPVFVFVAPDDPSRERSVITFEDMRVEQFRELLDHARSQSVVTSNAGYDAVGEHSSNLHRSGDPGRSPGLEWRDDSGSLLVTVWAPLGQPDPSLRIRVWQEVSPRTAECMVETARARLG